jgi:dTDP-glucose 4,6-dehydratase
MDVETIADLLLEEFELDDSYEAYVEDRPGHDRRYLLNSSRIRNQLARAPQIDFEAGFHDTIQWRRQNPQWWQPLLKRRAIDEAIWR